MQIDLIKKVFFLTLVASLASCTYTTKVTDKLFYSADSEFERLVIKADAAMDDADFSKAEELYEKAIIMKPQDLTLKLKQARAFQRDGKLAQAYNRYQIIIEQAPANKNDESIRETAQSDQARLGYKPEVIDASIQAQQEPKEEISEPTPAIAVPSAAIVVQPVEVAPEAVQQYQANEIASPQAENQAVDLDQKAVMLAVSNWSEAWSTKNLEVYFSSYESGFTGQLSDKKAWRQSRKNKILNVQKIKINLSDIQLVSGNDGSVDVTFNQNYQSGNYKDSGRKVLTLKKIDGRWLITQEVFK